MRKDEKPYHPAGLVVTASLTTWHEPLAHTLKLCTHRQRQLRGLEKNSEWNAGRDAGSQGSQSSSPVV